MKDKTTETLIKNKAKTLFFTNGNLGATTQEVADFAGVKRTLVNYYFGSRKELFKLIFDETHNEFRKQFHDVLVLKLSFKEKITQFIDTFTNFVNTYPYFEILLIRDMNEVNPESQERNAYFFEMKHSGALSNFLKEIQAEMDLGNITKMDSRNFYINICSLISYPIIMKSLYKSLFIAKEEEMGQLLKARKKMILDIIFIK